MDRTEARVWRLGRRAVRFGEASPPLLAWRCMSALALLAFLLQLCAGILHFAFAPEPAPSGLHDAPWRGDVPDPVPAPSLPFHHHGR